MTFKRRLRFRISFDIYSNDRYAASLSKVYNLEKEYIDRNEAYEKGGDLDTWAENVAEFKAIKIASEYIGSSTPDFRFPSTWKGIRNVYGSTYSAQDIYYTILFKSEPKIPLTVIEYIKEIEKYIKESKENISLMEDQLAGILVTPKDKRTSAQKSEISRLDNEIRKENEFIREYEYEIKKLKEQYKIE